ncbi:hypothetical protein HOLleu_05454 [Holothuria leucospilota]|uniref:Uncharacterized protein n=1 Tax=Holothuria leucospilota TaxID=206669 RepID=A0A9Q1CKR0_HOLLE|nr:hypothetical protein HOLleu_05454 [Holothuria leucospilota]
MLATESSPEPTSETPHGSPSQGDSQHDQATSCCTLDGFWGRSACSQCGAENGFKSDEGMLNSNCSCQRDSVVTPEGDPQPRTYSPYTLHPKLAQTRSDTKLLSLQHNHLRPHTVQEGISNDLIPRSGAFFSNRQGHLISVNGPIITSRQPKLKRTGFAKGRVRPNVNRQQREKRALLRASKVESVKQSVSMAITNSLS